MNNPNISIIVPIYGVEQYIERCARSLFEQDMNGLEFIFVNDCTPDESMVVLENVMAEYPHLKDCVKVINMLQNGGVANARNAALTVATGEYLGFVDSDDWIEKDMYSSLYSLAKKKNADIVGCDFIKSFKGHETVVRQPYTEEKNKNMERLLQGQLFPSLWAEIIKRSLFINDNIKFSPNLNSGEDKLVNVRLYINAQSFAWIDKPFYHYCLREDSACVLSTRKSVLNYFEVIKLIENHLQDKNMLSKYAHAIDCMKFEAKLPFYCASHLKDITFWRNTFPETNKQIFSYPIFDWKEKIELWLAVHHLESWAYTFVNFLTWQHSIRKKILCRLL